MTAFVFLVIPCLMVSKFIFCESKSTSTNTGLIPYQAAQVADAKNVLHVTIISSPSFKSNVFKHNSRATVPLKTATECLQPK